ncbi:TonB C-terminal domain-containing protein [Helicobacter kayseriensis]|uniref:TonB C-terminal domain-containing protein n=1 Tax=Helicobacter kayseriensis TaxID=2905877 RepID=UPI001E5AF53C|nr:TonB C-terminal domain-containing protein [Helicobacter kayseriensis]MCE3046884.1 TonB C-terminal domain-containing protein [Helicobacter kayseriensis]MCE3048456.1 TonB C-terminal domain-containing protein [Helicobacter kayseriensis]
MKSKFFLSGFFAIVFEFCLFLFLFFALFPKPQKHYVFQEKTALEFIQIEDVQQQKTTRITQKQEKPKPKKQTKPKTQEQKELQKSSPAPSPKVGADIKKLFAKIDSSNPPVREERIEDDRPTFSANTLKKSDYSFDQTNTQIQEESSKIQSALDSLWEKELEVSTPQLQDITEGEYDEWFAQVKEILYAKWTNSFYENVAIVVNIVIESDGRFRYRIVKYSKNQSYNIYMEELLEGLKDEIFPPYPKGRITLEVTFKTKEHENE